MTAYAIEKVDGVWRHRAVRGELRDETTGPLVVDGVELAPWLWTHAELAAQAIVASKNKRGA